MEKAPPMSIDSRQPYRFSGTGLREYEYVDAPRLDEFDRWAIDRDRSYDNSVSARYVSPDVVGYQDLDANGTWRVDASYGNVWIPNRVAAGWAPYRDGHWAWVDPWGWTWVDDAPWGFAVSHYGRWTNMSGTWGWVPGPVRSRAYYAPALVAFVGGSNFQLSISSGNVGGIAWFPLGPREVYRPSYAVSRGYFERRQHQQHDRQQHGHQQLLQQLERDECRLRQPAGAGCDRCRADDRVRAVAAGGAGGGPGDAGKGRQRAGSRRRGGRADREEACAGPPPRATSRRPARSSGPSSPAPRRLRQRSASPRNSSSWPRSRANRSTSPRARH